MSGHYKVLVIALLVSLASPPALANVICAVVERGRTTCTYFCQNGFICDLANRKCLPGPERLKEAQKMLDEAKRMKKDINGEKAKERSAKEAQMFGNQRGEYYYIWDGNPKEIPTPRYRPQYNFGYVKGSPSQSTPVRRTYSSAPSRFVVRSYLATLLTSAQRLPAGDPSRASIIAAARALIASNNIPFDIDRFLCQSAALPESQGRPALSVEWTVADVEQEVLDRGLCADAGDDKSRCLAQNFGIVVLDVEPEIKARCKAQEQDPQEQNITALAVCADRMLRNAWSQSSASPTAASRAKAEQCPPPPVSSARRDNTDDLRRRLRAALAARGERDEAPEADTTVPADTQAPEPAQVAGAPPARDPDTDEAFCAYIARKSVRGELTPGGGTPIPEYCKKALDAAKACTEQSCSMADVIAEEERRQKSNALPWGAADRESIAALQRPLLDNPAANAPPPSVNAPPPVAAPAPTVRAPAPTVSNPTAGAPASPSTPAPSVNATAPAVNAPGATVAGPTVNTK